MNVKYSNNAYSNLVAEVSVGATSFEVTSTALFPTVDSGEIAFVTIGQEVITVTRIIGNVFTCKPTTIIHSLGDTVDLYVTAELLREIEGRIVVDTDFYIATTGSDDNDGSSGSPWYSLKQAFDYLKGRWINTDVTVTINIASGTYTGLKAVLINHPCAGNIEVLGADSPSKPVLTFQDPMDPGYAICIERTSLKELSRLELKPYVFNGINTGLKVTEGSIVSANYLTLDGFYYGMYVAHGSWLHAESLVIPESNSVGIFIVRGSSIDVTGASITGRSDGYGHGIYADGFSYVDAQEVHIDRVSTGFYSSWGSFIKASSATITNCSGSPYVPNVTTEYNGTPNYAAGGWIFNSSA